MFCPKIPSFEETLGNVEAMFLPSSSSCIPHRQLNSFWAEGTCKFLYPKNYFKHLEIDKTRENVFFHMILGKQFE